MREDTNMGTTAAATAVEPEVEEIRTYTIPRPAMAAMKHAFGKLARRATKLGVPEPTLEISEVIRTPVRVMTTKLEELGGQEAIRKAGRSKPGFVRTTPEVDPKDARWTIVGYHEAHEVTVHGEAPKLPGWTLVAKIEPSEVAGKNFVLVAPGQDDKADMTTYGTVEMTHCDHCGTARWRKFLVVVYKDETGEQFIVGRTCMRDFLGHSNPERVVSWFTWIASLDDLMSGGDDDEGWGSYGAEEHAFTIQEVLEVTAAFIRLDGWMSRSRARQLFDEAADGEWSPTATADHVTEYLIPPKFTGYRAEEERRKYLEWKEKHQPTDADRETAAKALAWITEMNGSVTPDQDYLWNCCLVVEGEWVKARRLGIACSIVSSYQRTVEKALKTRKRDEARAKSEWIGTPKKREVFTLTLVSERPIEGQYGTSYLLTFSDPDGNIVKWFSSNPCNWIDVPEKSEKARGYRGMEIGGTYEIRATVKAHDTYRGGKETKINRGVVVKMVSEPEIERPEGQPDPDCPECEGTGEVEMNPCDDLALLHPELTEKPVPCNCTRGDKS